MQRIIRPRSTVDLAATLRPVSAGRGDPSVRIDNGEVWVATRSPSGPATLHFTGGGHRIEVEAWGPGGSDAIEAADGWVGAGDDPAGFEPGPLRALAHLHRGVRVTANAAVAEALLRVVPAQMVTSREAKSSYLRLAHRLGEEAPGPAPLKLPPDPAMIAAMAYHRLHPFGIERRRAQTMIRVGRHARRLDEAARMSVADAERRLRAVPGIGVWTVGQVAPVALGDPDAVPVGDYHLPNLVSWALAGEPRGDDTRMLELLEPFAGHRARAVRLLKASGTHAPRYGPRSPVRDHL